MLSFVLKVSSKSIYSFFLLSGVYSDFVFGPRVTSILLTYGLLGVSTAYFWLGHNCQDPWARCSPLVPDLLSVSFRSSVRPSGVLLLCVGSPQLRTCSERRFLLAPTTPTLLPLLLIFRTNQVLTSKDSFFNKSAQEFSKNQVNHHGNNFCWTVENSQLTI